MDVLPAAGGSWFGLKGSKSARVQLAVGGSGLKQGDAVGPYSGCTGGAWVASKGWNLGEINRCFIDWYGSLEGTWFGKCSKVIDILRLYERKTFKTQVGSN